MPFLLKVGSPEMQVEQYQPIPVSLHAMSLWPSPSIRLDLSRFATRAVTVISCVTAAL